MISIEALTVEFGATPLFKNVSFVINDNDRIALVGKNGAGKSTLLKIICGLQQPSSGTVAKENDVTIGYLPQVMRLADDTTVLEETRKAFANRVEQKQHIAQLQREMSERTDYDSEEYLKLVDDFTRQQEHYLILGGEKYEVDIEKTLLGLGFSKTDFSRPTSEFSGGWRMRIELAKILLRNPDVLLLDEPTNHLDIESIVWLETFLRESTKAAVLVSHDRAFINNVTNRTIEITARHIEDYRVKYDEFIELRKQRREQQLRAYANQQKEIADLKGFIERFRYKPTKAVQVQSRVKQLSKIVPVEVDDLDNKSINLKFPPCERSGDFPVICDEVAKSYGEHVIFSHVNLSIRRGEKVAFVGRNGEGKSTLVKCIMGQIPFAGDLKIGHNVQIGYFAQNQAQLLDDNPTIFETIDRVATGEIRTRINDILGAFMFGGEISEKKVKVLSGGERARLAMIKLLLEPVNLLILDEPTNHLDIPTKEILRQAIQSFDGTAIIVSHDRAFLDGLVSKVYEFNGGKVKEHLGGIYDFLQAYDAENVEDALKVKETKAEEPIQEAKSNSNRESYLERKEELKRINRLRKEMKEAEDKITEMENRVKELDALLLKEENASDMELVSEYTALQESLEKENGRWTEIVDELEKQNQGFGNKILKTNINNQ